MKMISIKSKLMSCLVSLNNKLRVKKTNRKDKTRAIGHMNYFIWLHTTQTYKGP